MNFLSTHHPSSQTQSTAQLTRSHTSYIPSNTLRTNPFNDTTHTQPLTNTHNIHPNTSDTTTYHTLHTSTVSSPVVSNLIYLNSSASIPEPNKPFGGLIHNYTSEENQHHIEARVTFSPKMDHEYKL